MIIPTTGLSFRSPSHRLHNGCGSGAGGENTATTVPMYSPSTSTTRTKPPGCPVRSLTVCHSPAGVDAWPQAGPHQTRMRTKKRLSNVDLTPRFPFRPRAATRLLAPALVKVALAGSLGNLERSLIGAAHDTQRARLDRHLFFVRAIHERLPEYTAIECIGLWMAQQVQDRGCHVYIRARCPHACAALEVRPPG